MNEQPIQDINDGKPWSEMDLFDLRNSLAYGRSIQEVAGFLCRSGTVILKRASASRPSGEWNEDDFDVLADSAVVGRIFNSAASPIGTPWMWTLAFGHHEDRTPTHGYAATREAAMAAFAKSWRREN
jgi:hypothetical protein